MKKFLSEALYEYQEQTSRREADEVRPIIKRRILSEFLVVQNLKQLRSKKTNYIFDNISLAGFFALADPIFQEANFQVANERTRSVEKSNWNRFGKWLQQQG